MKSDARTLVLVNSLQEYVDKLPKVGDRTASAPQTAAPTAKLNLTERKRPRVVGSDNRAEDNRRSPGTRGPTSAASAAFA